MSYPTTASDIPTGGHSVQLHVLSQGVSTRIPVRQEHRLHCVLPGATFYQTGRKAT